MLQVMNDTIREIQTTLTTTNTFTPSVTGGGGGSNTVDYFYPNYQTIYWSSYPVYVCTDKTKKAIEVLKTLQAEKLLKCESVPRFIELVEKIAGIL